MPRETYAPRSPTRTPNRNAAQLGICLLFLVDDPLDGVRGDAGFEGDPVHTPTSVEEARYSFGSVLRESLIPFDVLDDRFVYVADYVQLGPFEVGFLSGLGILLPFDYQY